MALARRTPPGVVELAQTGAILDFAD